MQRLNGRRGSVFSVRLTDEERARVEMMQRLDSGPRKIGPWMVWRALTAAVLPAREGSTPTAERVILDLCAGSGSWSAPYAAAGYDVRRITLPDSDVRVMPATVLPRRRVWGVLAAPPCNQFSLARNGHEKRSPRDLVRGMEVVNACLRIVQQARPAWWALENPVGLLSRFLGTPRDVWNPCDFGDPWTKRTAIWGEYVIPARGPFVKPLGSGPFCDVHPQTPPRYCRHADHRAKTPGGFARAFFEANP